MKINLFTNRTFVKGAVYNLHVSEVFWNQKKRRYDKFRYVTPAVETPINFTVCDCWIIDEEGNIHPDYSASPVPIRWESIENPPVGFIGEDL